MTAMDAGDDVAAVEEAHQHVARFGRRRGEPRAERQRLARREHAAGRQRGPGIDLLAGAVADREAQPRAPRRRAPRRSRSCLRPPAPDAVVGLGRGRDVCEVSPRRLTGRPIAA